VTEQYSSLVSVCIA